MTSHDRLDPDLIQAKLRTRRIAKKVLVYDRTSSTSDVAAEYARNPDNAGLVVFAEEQTTGRGRTGAKWYGSRGDSLLFSAVLTDCNIGGDLLSLACAVAVAEAIGQVGGHRARIKWPNDIILDGRKVAGILVESKVWSTRGAGQRIGNSAHPSSDTSPASSGVHIIGIGINCHQTRETFPDDLQATATSLDMTSGTRCRRITVARRVLTSLDQWLRSAERSKAHVIETWSHLSTQLGQRITLSYNGKRFTGNCIGVDPENGLILQLDRGGVRMFHAAQTSVVKT